MKKNRRQGEYLRGGWLMLGIVVVLVLCGVPLLGAPHFNRTDAAIASGGFAVIVGLAMTLSERFARWGVNYGGQPIWEMLFGEKRAVMVVRFVLGPLVAVTGAALLLKIFR